MNAPKNFVRIVNRKRYSVATSKLLAHDSYWDGHNFERGCRNTFLIVLQNLIILLLH